MREKVHPDALVAIVAGRQHGVISTQQLLACGLTHNGIARRVAASRLFRVHRGVFAVGHETLTHRGRWKAATLAVPRSVLSHRSAAELWALMAPRGGETHVSVPHRSTPAGRDGVRIIRSRSLPEERTAMQVGIPVTMPARTLADLATVATPADVRRATRAAEQRNLPLNHDHRSDKTESDLELDFLAVCRAGGVPEPEVNVRIGRHRVDFLWRDASLVVEVDGYIYHRGRQAMRDDNDRDLELALRGLQVIRIEDTRINEESAGVAKAILRLLSRAS
jgi:very-short-patch-repair endonuclease